jgi:DNA-dependent metalloprotease WSS1
MLHELSHIIHGPHDAKFHALWNQLREEHEALVRKGYTGEGFLSDGKRLGGGRIPMHEARRLARAAAEKRRVLSSGSGQRLGGLAPRPGQDIRAVIVNAVDRRNKTLQGCGNMNHNEREIHEISETATRNGFKTQAEEDAANDAAIAQALWELVQEDEKAKYGDSYIPPSQANPMGNGGGAVFVESAGASSKAPRIPTETKPTDTKLTDSKPKVNSGPPVETPKGWSCEICTLHNPTTFLCCDACGTERPESVTQKLAKQPVTQKKNTVNNNGGSSRTTTAASRPQPSSTWTCSFCGMKMERQWWTCSTCGVMKDSS